MFKVEHFLFFFSLCLKQRTNEKNQLTKLVGFSSDSARIANSQCHLKRYKEEEDNLYALYTATTYHPGDEKLTNRLKDY